MKKPKGERFNVVRGRFIRSSPRKARVVVDMIRSIRVSEALDLLRFSKKGVSQAIAKLLESGVANINEHAKQWDVDRLVVAQAFVDEGPTMRRYQPRAMGRATRIRKRTSHVTIVLEQEE
ncbi:MAG: 50S ribosomal protein L22 [Bradymonadales bacterium]|nr:50S ribosomal protein L22 [Bradymonadales bacterium]